MDLKPFKELYDQLHEDTGERFTLYKLIEIYRTESDWVGTGHQMMKLKEIITNVTGIRPGTCAGCMVDVLRNMDRFISNYERDNPPTEETVEVREKRKRIGQ